MLRLCVVCLPSLFHSVQTLIQLQIVISFDNFIKKDFNRLLIRGERHRDIDITNQAQNRFLQEKPWEVGELKKRYLSMFGILLEGLTNIFLNVRHPAMKVVPVSEVLVLYGKAGKRWHSEAPSCKNGMVVRA